MRVSVCAYVRVCVCVCDYVSVRVYEGARFSVSVRACVCESNRLVLLTKSVLYLVKFNSDLRDS